MKALWTPLVLTCLTLGAAAADKLPHYDLPAGRQLSYTFDGSATGPTAFTSHEVWTLTVLAENPDGSRSILADGVMQRDQTGEQYKQLKGKSENQIAFVFDINARGQLLNADATGDYARTLFFPLLPANTADAASGWLDGEDKNVVKTNSAAEFSFELNHTDRVYSGTSVRNVQFDFSKGLVSKAQRDYSQDKSTGVETLTLTKEAKLDAAALELARQFLIFSRAQRDYKDACEKVYEDPAHFRELLTQAGTIIAEASKKVSNPDVQKAFERTMRGFQAEANGYARQAQKLVTVLNKPAPDFSVTDFDGTAWSKEKLKGSVVVLDFWFRGCGWCMKAIPQIKEVVAQFKDKPVHVFGVNVDDNDEDGKFVIKVLDLHYAQLKGRSMVESFGVSGYPTLIIMDQEGIVRCLHFGFSLNLKEKLGKKIEMLLSVPAGK